MDKYYTRLLMLFCLLPLLLAGCMMMRKEEGGWNKISFADLPQWPGDVSATWPAWQQNCRRLLALAPNKELGRQVIAARFIDACKASSTIAIDDSLAQRRFFEEWFTPYEVEGQGKFTGYFAPLYHASRNRAAPFLHPLYGLPANPLLSRDTIQAGAIKEAPLFYFDNPVDPFLLQIQGSGELLLADGHKVRVGYAGDNGAPYVAIGRPMAEAGLIPRQDISLFTITDWLKTHPKEAPRWMALNPRYIYVREMNGPGPIGALGAPLTAGRSLAIDPAFIPLGAPIWLDTYWPGTKKRMTRLVIAQDKGSAIKGPVRGDLFWGNGPEAEKQAGIMNEAGRYYILMPKL